MDQLAQAAQGNPVVALALTFFTGAAFWRFVDGFFSRRASLDSKRIDESGDIRRELRERIRELEDDSDKYRNLYFDERNAHAGTKQTLATTTAQLEYLRTRVQQRIDAEQAEREREPD